MGDRPLPFKAVIFDLDGTLIEFKFRIKEAHKAMVEYVGNLGYDVSRIGEQTRTQDVIDDVKRQWDGLSRTDSVSFEQIRNGLFKILDEFESNAALDSRPFPASLETIRSIHQDRIFAGLVTNSGRHAVEIILIRHGFAPYLSSIVTRNEMSRLKPSPVGLISAIKQLGVEPERSLYVGDSILDIQAARQARMSCAAVATGIYDQEVLRKFEPDFMLDSIEDLKSIVH